jgi:hypothetical protein
LPPDPHRLDGDKDGVGCETSQNRDNGNDGNDGNDGDNCDSSYPDDCILSPPPDLDCGDPGVPKDFKVTGSDPHGFDGDNDGIGCESNGTQPPDPCEEDPDLPECPPPDPCEENPDAEGCQDPCIENPDAEGCARIPPCEEDPDAPECQGQPDPCKENPDAPECEEGVAENEGGGDGGDGEAEG